MLPSLTPDPYDAIVDVRAPWKGLDWIEPGVPDQSALFVKTACKNDEELLGATVLCSEHELFHDWIVRGAPRD